METEAYDRRYRFYRDAIRQRVCGVCLDSRDDGTCSLSGRVCPVEAHLPGVVEAILATDSLRMDDYVAAVRARVCPSCRHQDSAGRCALRNAGDCALEAYLSLVVDAVETAGQGPAPAELEGARSC